MSHTEKSRIIKGKVFVVGDDIDTDQIIPARYLNLVPTIEKEYRQLGSHAMSGLPDTYPPFVEQGAVESEYSIIVAGKNFGCGSSREHAPVSLGAAGIQAVVAQSYARIFFRNCISLGELYPLETEESLCRRFKTGDAVEIDIKNMQISRDGDTYKLKELGAVKPVIDAGGIFEYARSTGMITTARS
ncbi:MAG: 3-isopropylmalate dehydratase [Verrucomicrobiota bacterium]